MFTGSNRRAVTPELRSYVEQSDRRIEQLSGQTFGDAYRDGLLRDVSVVLDSEPPISGVLAANRVGDRGLDFLARAQTAHYVEGRRISNRETLFELAEEIGLDPQAFRAALEAVSGEVTQQHMRRSRSLLSRLGGQGFPTFALERDGNFEAIDLDAHFGRPQEWQGWLRSRA